MKQVSYHAFSLHYETIQRLIISDVIITAPFSPQNSKVGDFENLPKENLNALWDTGASNSAITKKVADNLKLIPITFANVHHADGNTLQNVHLVNIYLPNKVAVSGVKVTECKSTQGNFEVIIGMDIITLGDFAFTNYNNKSLFTFRVPSYKSIDFVHDFNELKKNNLSKIGRNEE